MEKHLTVLAWLHIAYSALLVLVALLVFVGVAGGGLLSGDARAAGITMGVGALVACILLVLAAPGLIGGFGLLKHQSWARVLVLILGVLALFSFPVGTALGIYTIWVLTRPEVNSLLRS